MLQYKVSTRNLSCFCKFCQDPASAPDRENVCQHLDICGEWSAHNMLKNQPPNRCGRRAVQIAEQPLNDADQEPPATPIPTTPAANRRGRRAVQIAEQPFNDADQEPPATPTPSPHHDSPLPVTPSVSTLDQLDDPPSPALSISSRPALLPVTSGADTVCSSSSENSPTASDHEFPFLVADGESPGSPEIILGSLVCDTPTEGTQSGECDDDNSSDRFPYGSWVRAKLDVEGCSRTKCYNGMTTSASAQIHLGPIFSHY